MQFVNTIIKRQDGSIHKGDCGRILLIAGSLGMAAAAVQCGRGIMQSGVGRVNIPVPKDLFPILQVGVPEITCVSRRSLYLDKLSKYDAVAAGQG